MTRTVKRTGVKWQVATALLAGMLLAAPGNADPSMVSLQDLQVAGRVLHFLEARPTKIVILAVTYNAANVHSHDEATAIVTLAVGGIAVGDIMIKPLLVEQADLAETAGYGAIFATSEVNPVLVQQAMKQHQVPCLTAHLEQVEQGVCTVAIRSLPSVSIVVNQTNARSAGIRFATAFRMMVSEI